MGAVTLAGLVARYGRRWTIHDAIGGGWYALRIGGVSELAQSRGLAVVACGANLAELEASLEAQRRLEARMWPESVSLTSNTDKTQSNP